ncbi:hypothetical protein GP486_001569 [Trichoglossum hirsutum]|uniref:Uncharacterized protein n=1 Tax=Trichoglossum hirsutum TaxID=265104 RepID=A0A9P8LGT4_9PEZI|nr:hypothetical protein GP486_001569 [Trichoglossum hirsutum]
MEEIPLTTEELQRLAPKARDRPNKPPEPQVTETPPTLIAVGTIRGISGYSPSVLTNTPPGPRSNDRETSKRRSNTPTSIQLKRRRRSNVGIGYTQVGRYSDFGDSGGYLEELELCRGFESTKETPDIPLPMSVQDVPLPMCPSPFRVSSSSPLKRRFPEPDLDTSPHRQSPPNRVPNIPSLKRSLPEEESDITLLKDFLDKATAKRRAKTANDESVKHTLPQQQQPESPRMPLEKLDPNLPSPQKANIDISADGTSRVGDSGAKGKRSHYGSDGTDERDESPQQFLGAGGRSSHNRHTGTPIIKSRVAPQALPGKSGSLKALTLANTNRNMGFKRSVEDIHELNRRTLNDPSPPMERPKRRCVTWDQQLTYFKDPDYHIRILGNGVGTTLAPEPQPILGRLLRERRKEVERGQARAAEDVPRTRPEYGLEMSIVAQTAEVGADTPSSKSVSNKRRRANPKPKGKRLRGTAAETEEMGGVERVEEAIKPVPPSRIPSRRAVSNTPLRKPSALGGVAGERRSLRNRVQAQPRQ